MRYALSAAAPDRTVASSSAKRARVAAGYQARVARRAGQHGQQEGDHRARLVRTEPGRAVRARRSESGQPGPACTGSTAEHHFCADLQIIKLARRHLGKHCTRRVLDGTAIAHMTPHPANYSHGNETSHIQKVAVMVTVSASAARSASR